MACSDGARRLWKVDRQAFYSSSSIRQPTAAPSVLKVALVIHAHSTTSTPTVNEGGKSCRLTASKSSPWLHAVGQSTSTVHFVSTVLYTVFIRTFALCSRVDPAQCCANCRRHTVHAPLQAGWP